MGFDVGDKVRLLSDPTQIGMVEALAHHKGSMQFYRVFWGGPHPTRVVAEDDIERCSENSEALGTWADFQRRITYERLRRGRPLRNNIYAFNASRTRFFPYQFKPLLKFLDSPKPRILIADEVGLGKTIEAGLILTEMRARSTIRRVLVVCPSNLVQKWRFELHRRFGEKEFEPMKGAQLKQWMADCDQDPSIRLYGIIALESIRQEGLLDQLEEYAPELDLTIIDEAHHMRNFATLSRRAGAVLRNLSSSLLLLSATPVHLGDENLYSLMNLLDEDEFPNYETAKERFAANIPIVAAKRHVESAPPNWDEATSAVDDALGHPWHSKSFLLADVQARLKDLATEPNASRSPERMAIIRDLEELNLLGHLLSRTRKREVQENAATRKPMAKLVEFTPQEWAFYEAVTKFSRAHAVFQTPNPFVREWIVNTPQRRLASSIPAMVRHYRTKLMEAGGEDDSSQEEVKDHVKKADIKSLEQARQELLAVLAEWNDQAPDSKFEVLRSVLTAPDLSGERVMIFAFFRGTLEYLEERLSRLGMKVALIHGGVHPEDREKIIKQFRGPGGPRILLSSRVGSEGLDFQFCHIMVNYDLPWNPMEVEQRIGRLDRIGQKSDTIQIINLWVKNTIEERILNRLYERIKVFERSIGALEGIIGPIIQKLEMEMLSTELSESDQDARSEQALLKILTEADYLDKLETSSGQLLSADDFFTEEVNKITANRRYVTGGQIRAFVEDFLRRQAPKSSLHSTDGTGKEFRLRAADDLQSLILRAPQETDWPLLSQYLRDKGDVRVTFDGEYAFDNPDVDLLNVLHPLTRLICGEIDRDTSVLLRRCLVELKTALLPPGMYGFNTFLLHIQAAKRQSTLEFVVIDDKGNSALDEKGCELLLAKMVEEGRTPQIRHDQDITDRIASSLNKTVDIFWARRDEKESLSKRSNTLIIDRRIASLDSYFKRRIELVETQKKKAIIAEKKESYIRGLTTRIENMKADWTSRRGSLEEARRVSVSHEDDILSGILIVR